jgi:1-acyl-sn-glycerol-3-phosphate acyltransferase
MKYRIYKFIRVICRFLVKFLYLAEFQGRENIPSKGNVILAGNHTNYRDALIMIAGPDRIVHMLAKKEIFSSKLKNFFFRSMGCIPVDRKIHDENAKSEALDYLNNGEMIGIFPEGTTNDKDELLPFKYGAVSFAKKTNSYIVPFAITGKYKLFKKSIKITYGKPYKTKNDNLDIENDILRNKIIELKGNKL